MVCQACHFNGTPSGRFFSGCGQPFVNAAYAPYNQQQPPYATSRIVRPRYGRVIAGVCAGLADHFGWDPIVVRLAVVALVLFGCGSPVLLYFVAWIVMPNGPYYYAVPQQPTPVGTQPAA